jgi:hypothetical protein
LSAFIGDQLSAIGNIIAEGMMKTSNAATYRPVLRPTEINRAQLSGFAAQRQDRRQRGQTHQASANNRLTCKFGC